MSDDAKAAAKAEKAALRRQMKSAARLYAVQALFQMESSGQTFQSIILEFEMHRFGEVIEGEAIAEGDVELFRKLVTAAVNWQGKIDQATDRALVAKWPIDRIDSVLRATFRAAGAEFVDLDTPPKVIVNEFVDVAKAFFPDGKEAKFVNAVLDHMGHELRPEGW